MAAQHTDEGRDAAPWIIIRVSLHSLGIYYCIPRNAGTLLLQSASIFDKALQKVMDEPVLLGSTQRSVAMRRLFGQWVSKVRSQSTFATVVTKQLAAEAFGTEILSARTASSKYERMWRGYHRFASSTNLLDMWSIAVETEASEEFFPLFVQLATIRIMEEAVKLVFPLHGTSSGQLDNGPALKVDDEQTVRYVAGYVAMILKKKYKKTTRR